MIGSLACAKPGERVLIDSAGVNPYNAADRRELAQLIAVASGKGGVGKTWFSITLAHAAARAGRTALLFDGDLGLANVDAQLGMTAQLRRNSGGNTRPEDGTRSVLEVE